MTDEFEEVVELGPEDVLEEDELPRVAEEAQVVRRTADSALVPVVQAVAAAATGFVAGAAALALVRRHSARRLQQAQRRALTGWTPPGEWRTRTFLVHVHVLGRPAE